jgi:hypothetical protein
MGGSSYSDDLYKAREADRVTRGVPTFAHTAAVRSGAVAATAHSNLDPKGVVRESRDSDAHPDSVAIGIVFDVTGSMHGIPVQLQKKLPDLMGLLLRQGYIKDPQICFAAVGDFYSDKAPLQVGQFESGVEMDDDLTKILLEGGGGGSFEESYELALYFFGKKTSIDCLEKRGKKGYLFLVGDEKPYPVVKRDELLAVLGETAQEDLPIERVVEMAREKYEVFFIIPTGSSHGGRKGDLKRLHEVWGALLGEQRVIDLDDPDKVCEVIGHTIGLMEGNADAAHFAADASVSAALDPLAKSTALARTGSADIAEASKRPDTSVRL